MEFNAIRNAPLKLHGLSKDDASKMQDAFEGTCDELLEFAKHDPQLIQLL